MTDLQRLPLAVEEVLRTDRALYRRGTDLLSEATDSLYLGRGILYPIALEGALKLKEISYLHAEGYPAGEMKHGPIALVTDGFPVVAVATATATREKLIGNLMEVKARGATLLRSPRPMPMTWPRSRNLFCRCRLSTRCFSPSSRWCRFSCSPTVSPSSSATMSISRETSPNRSLSNSGCYDPVNSTKERIAYHISTVLGLGDKLPAPGTTAGSLPAIIGWWMAMIFFRRPPVGSPQPSSARWWCRVGIWASQTRRVPAGARTTPGRWSSTRLPVSG